MILLDTNIIIDLFGSEDHQEAHWSRRIYDSLPAREQIGCNLVVVAELAAEDVAADALLHQFDVFRIEVLDLELGGALRAGRAHQIYRQRGGIRTSILADFLIAGHAEALGATFMTRDRRLGSYFPELTLITPETHP